ncbi:hypothetical protein [Methanobrevibacter sp.]|uniref:hypothetical protein n=1 Tax=Methanobrevibacter sp. TaxID=66852 RepID=UPI0025FCB2BD|nr:hypothetical protein [Methanobrevibacter sp.]MBQ2665561.1 hypothetical protein [Methanobrevibacter sp.]
MGISFVSATDADSVSSDVVGHVCVSSDVVDSVLGAPALGSGLGGGGDQNYY